MEIKRAKQTIQEFLCGGHYYLELKGRKIIQDGEELYISNRLFNEKEVSWFNKYARALMPYPEEVRFYILLYGAETPEENMVRPIYSQIALVEESFNVPNNVHFEDLFEYGGYSFIPAGTWHSWHITGDFREMNSHLMSDWQTNLNNYRGKDCHWSHAEFYKAAGKDCEDDIFFCVERQRYYVPCENELFMLKDTPENHI